MEGTLSTANELRIEHPRNPRTGDYIFMKTDFFISLQQNGGLIDAARTIKNKDNILDKRIIEKFEIELIYWERKDVSWPRRTDV